ncbi:hypothetical protein [Ideonella paludis]|uniref:Uncharacterized protein n=1 Tax=Ideonella paludis TaxID=1233411 RepID=A0ABS5DYT7_9BURK|nr:hypothetical protein [Ideonella paludis]MBQ0936312.1 hypothetical protein [Ideonella paludis]
MGLYASTSLLLFNTREKLLLPFIRDSRKARSAMVEKWHLGMLTVLLLLGSSASAAPLSESISIVPFNMYGPAGTIQLIPFYNSASTLQIKAPASGRYILSFSAECTVSGSLGSIDNWMDVDIIVNTFVVPPTSGNFDKFCSTDGSGGATGTNRVSIIIPISLEKGRNSLQIQARINYGESSVRLSNMVVLVF